jgi:hypothetical protein
LLPDDLTLARICLHSETDAIGFDFIDNGADTGVCFGIVKCDGYDIVCFRGSITAEDWMTDAQAEMISMQGIGQVHFGFSKNMLFVKAKLQTMIRPNPVVCGHSLGAARAAIYSGLLSQKIHDEPRKVALFGCPRPGAQQLADVCEPLNMVSYRNWRDGVADPVTDVPLPFPEFPYEHARKFTEVKGMIDQSLGWPMDIHHMLNYIEGIKNAAI